MRELVVAAAVLLSGAGAAYAQDGEKRKVDELQREFDRAMKGLAEKFEQERGRLEKEFRAAKERLMQPGGAPERPERVQPPQRPERVQPPQRPERPERPEPRGIEETLKRLLERVESLEKRLDREMPRLRELPRELPKIMPKNFDFKEFKDFGQFREFMPREWRDMIPRFKDEDFRFDFKRPFEKFEKDFKHEFKPEPPKKKEKKDKKDEEDYS